MAAIASRWLRRIRQPAPNWIRIMTRTLHPTRHSPLGYIESELEQLPRGCVVLPQVGLSATMRKIRSRTSLLVFFQPCVVRARSNASIGETTTGRLSGVTRTRINDLFPPDHTRRRTTQNNFSRSPSRGWAACHEEPPVDGAGRGSRGRALPGSESHKESSRAGIEDAQTSENLNEMRAAQAVSQVIDSANVRNCGEPQEYLKTEW